MNLDRRVYKCITTMNLPAFFQPTNLMEQFDAEFEIEIEADVHEVLEQLNQAYEIFDENGYLVDGQGNWIYENGFRIDFNSNWVDDEGNLYDNNLVRIM